MLIVKPEDNFYVEYKMKPNADDSGSATTDKMTVGARLTSQGTEMELGGLEFDYDAASITKAFPTTYRYPDFKSFPNLKVDLPGRYSHEMNIQPLTGGVDDIFNIDATNRGYSLTSNTVARGVKSGSYQSYR